MKNEENSGGRFLNVLSVLDVYIMYIVKQIIRVSNLHLQVQ